jgi:signal transduction histidine kinase
LISPAGRLLVATIALLAASAVAGCLILARAARGYSDELTQHLNRNIAMYVVAEAPLIRAGRVDEAQLTRLARQAMVVNPMAEVYLLDPAGHVVGSRGERPLKTTRVRLAPLREFLSPTAHRPIYGDDPRGDGMPRVFSTAEIHDGSRLQGYVYVVLGGAASEGAAATLAGSHILRAGVTTSLIVLVLTAIAAWALTGWLVRPLSRLHARVIELGNRHAPHGADAPIDGHIDLDAVRAAVDSLTARLAAQVASLEQADRMRRDLYASISHDLRTPLTAVRGYLDTLVRGDSQLTPDRRRAFISIALRHCERLGRLVDQVFALARLDATVVRLRREPVALTELAQDVVSKFQGLAEAARVRLQFDVDTGAPAVLADIGMLETVLQNLLDNALRHTRAGGEIVVSVTAGAGEVLVSVNDTGEGMAPSDLARLKCPLEIGSGGRTGLGLAIVGRVLDLHGSALRLVSASGVGTQAAFALAAVSTVDPFELQENTAAREEFVMS